MIIYYYTFIVPSIPPNPNPSWEYDTPNLTGLKVVLGENDYSITFDNHSDSSTHLFIPQIYSQVFQNWGVIFPWRVWIWWDWRYLVSSNCTFTWQYNPCKGQVWLIKPQRVRAPTMRVTATALQCMPECKPRAELARCGSSNPQCRCMHPLQFISQTQPLEDTPTHQ